MTNAILNQIAADAVKCQRCSLCEYRKNVVWGDGSQDAQVMFIGEGPGEEEDERGLPFVGRSGQLLRETISSSGFLLERVFITNTVMCRPPNNRDPTPDEIKSCRPWLDSKIQTINPKLIITIGRISSGTILEKNPEDIKITKVAGEIFPWGNIDVIPILHPSYILRGRSSREPDYLIQMSKISLFAKERGLIGVL